MTTDKSEPVEVTRRGWLVGTGAVGAGLAAASAGLLPGAGPAARAATAAPAGLHGRLGPGVPADSGLFGRMFPACRHSLTCNDTVRAALLEVGMPGGIMDAHDDLAAGPKSLIVDPTVNGNPTATNPYGTNPDNPTMTAGSTFVGQFTDHDITFDQTSAARCAARPAGVAQHPDTRTRPGLGVRRRPRSAPRPLRAEPGRVGRPEAEDRLRGGVHEDVPRVANGDGTYTALLGDPATTRT